MGLSLIGFSKSRYDSYTEIKKAGSKPAFLSELFCVL